MEYASLSVIFQHYDALMKYASLCVISLQYDAIMKYASMCMIFQHYDAIMKYVSQGPLFVDVHMHRPHTTSRHFMDALLAFWPGLQVSHHFLARWIKITEDNILKCF